MNSFLDALIKPCLQFISSLGDKNVHGYTIAKAKLAEGGFGFVHQAVKDGRTLAMKEIRCEGAVEDVEREVAAHLAFGGSEDAGALPRHRASTTCGYVMPLLDSVWEGKDGKRRVDSGGEGVARAWLVFPFYAQGSAQDALNASLVMAEGAPTTIVDGGLPTRTVLRLGLGLCEALAGLHAYSGPHVPALGGGGPFAHRDVCPRNVMVDDAGRAVLIDLGSVAPAQVDVKTRGDALRLQEEAATRSSMGFRAPELWAPSTGTVVTAATDVWAVGATLYALAYGASPFESVVASGSAAAAASGSGAAGSAVRGHRHVLPLKYDACSESKVLAAIAFPDGPAAVAAAAAAGGAAAGSHYTEDSSLIEGERGPMPQAFRDLVSACLSLDPAARPAVQAVAAALADMLTSGAAAPPAATASAKKTKKQRERPAPVAPVQTVDDNEGEADADASEEQPALA